MDSLGGLFGRLESLEEGSLKSSRDPWKLIQYKAMSSCSCDSNTFTVWVKWDFYFSHLAVLGYNVISQKLATATAIKQLESIDKELPNEGYMTTKNLCEQCEQRNYDIKALQINYCPRYHSALEMYMKIRDLPLPTLTTEQHEEVVRSLEPDKEEFKEHDYDDIWDYSPHGPMYYPRRLQDLISLHQALRSLAYGKRDMVLSMFSKNAN